MTFNQFVKRQGITSDRDAFHYYIRETLKIVYAHLPQSTWLSNWRHFQRRLKGD